MKQISNVSSSMDETEFCSDGQNKEELELFIQGFFETMN